MTAVKRLFTHRVLGVLFIGLLVFGVWLVSAVFSQKFVSFEHVTVRTDNVGLNLPEKADVKVRGVIVGQVLKATPLGGKKGASLELGIKPDQLKTIPADVTASILPKTLFGEKFVELNIPDGGSSKMLSAGAVLHQTQMPVEVEQVLNDLYPLLRTVQPAELNYTLNALSTALEGRGEALGENIVTLNAYLKRINPQIPQLIDDVKQLDTVSSTYADVVPQLAETLRNSVKTGNTLVSRQTRLRQFLNETTSFSGTAQSFLDTNGENIIRLGKLSAPQVALLKRYSPEYPCLLRGIVRQLPMLAGTFRGFVFHIHAIVQPAQPRGYTPADRPVYGADRPPSCARLPYPPVPYPPLPNIDDGVNGLGRGDGQRTATGFSNSGASATGVSVGVGGTETDKKVIRSLVSPAIGVPYDKVPDIATLLFGPVAAGTEVSAR